MTIDTRRYAQDTSITSSMPWGLYIKARALCPDGRVRTTRRIAATADTFFSVPAQVNVNHAGRRRVVSGYITVSGLDGSDVWTEDNPPVVKFRPYDYGKNSGVFAEIALEKISAAVTPKEADHG